MNETTNAASVPMFSVFDVILSGVREAGRANEPVTLEAHQARIIVREIEQLQERVEKLREQRRRCLGWHD